MTESPSIEALGDHHYVVRGRENDDAVSVRFYVDPDMVAGLGLPEVEDSHVIEATLRFLLRHQRFDELPAQLDLADVAAAYEDFDEQLRSAISRAAG